MRALEEQAASCDVSFETLRQNAGMAVAKTGSLLLDNPKSARVLVLVGPGNNGSDGLVAANLLSTWGAYVTAYLCAQRPERDPDLDLAVSNGVHIQRLAEDSRLKLIHRLLKRADLLIDSVLGIGQHRPIQGKLRGLFLLLRERHVEYPNMTALALDVPSGLDADRGTIDPVTPHVDVTVSLGYPKKGLLLFPGAQHTGLLEVPDIGIPPGLDKNVALDLITPDWIQQILPRRPLDANKGTFGRVMVAAGSSSFIGAAYLACMGAARVGAGYVTLATLPNIIPIMASKLTETTYLQLPESSPDSLAPEASRVLRQALEGYDTLLIGCGLGQDPATELFVCHTVLADPAPTATLVLDADALNLLSRQPRWWNNLKSPTVLTPHPGEMARLLNCQVVDIESNRIQAALEAAKQWQVTVVLKGAYTIVASSEGMARVSPFANPGLATAGTGDVLAGVIAGLSAQGLSPYDAAAAGVFIHAATAQSVQKELGDTGIIASDLLPTLPKTIKSIREGNPPPSRVAAKNG